MDEKDLPFVFGGTFNPIHKGHLHIIHQVLVRFPFCRMVIVPAFVPPFKEKDAMPAFEKRFELVKLALDDYCDIYSAEERSRIELSDVERRFGKKVCTSELVQHFLSLCKCAGRVTFVAGDDILARLDKWYDAEYLKEHVKFLIYPRINDMESYCRMRECGFCIELLEGEMLDASSTQIRNGGFDNLLTDRVRERIAVRGDG